MNDWDQIESLRKQVASYKTMLESLQSQIAHYRIESSKYDEAVRTLESERAANMMLTEELAVVAKKAARYDWLRHGDNDEGVIASGQAGYAYLPRNEMLDEIIDAAMELKK